MFTTIEDLIASAVAQKPGEFEEAFNALIIERAANAIHNKKTEIAQTIFNPVEEEVISEDEEEIEEADIKGFSKNVMGGYSGQPQNTAGIQGSPGTQSGGGSIVKGRTGEADIYRGGGGQSTNRGQGQSGASFEGGKAPRKKKK